MRLDYSSEENGGWNVDCVGEISAYFIHSTQKSSKFHSQMSAGGIIEVWFTSNEYRWLIYPNLRLTRGTFRTLHSLCSRKILYIFILSLSFIWYSQVFNQFPKNFTKGYNNPCWQGKDDVTGLPRRWCLPKFFLVGVAKCGTTDIYQKICSHHQIIGAREKEPSWWTRKRLSNLPCILILEYLTHPMYYSFRVIGLGFRVRFRGFT